MADQSTTTLRPDYGRSIVNLVSALGGSDCLRTSLYPPLIELAERDLAERPVVLLVADGLGDDWLLQYPDSFLCRHRLARLTSVFPTTTATAVTALALGVPAQQHAIPGWFTYLAELGAVTMPLPFMPRGGTQSYTEQGVEAAQFIDTPPLMPALMRPVSVVQPAYIADSSFSRGLFADLPRFPYGSLKQWLQQIKAALKSGLARGRDPLVWAYWTELDALGHQFGINSRETEQHFYQLDRCIESLAQDLTRKGVTLIVTADHGQIDTSPSRQVLLNDHPLLQQMLAHPLCGEPRAAFCYLRHGAVEDFEHYLAETLPFIDSVTSQQLLAEGVFGRGAASERLAARIGDRILLPQANWVIRDRLMQERFHPMIGVHGGLSAQELFVPLVVVEP